MSNNGGKEIRAKKIIKAQHNNIKSGDSDYDCPNENNTGEVVSSNNKLHNQTEDNEQISQQQNVWNKS